MSKVGDRVGAVASIKNGIVSLFGYGVYEGDQTPDPNIVFMGVHMKDILKDYPDHIDPKIRLDNGDIVWGCECWWGPEAGVKNEIAQHNKVVTINVKDYRNSAKI